MGHSLHEDLTYVFDILTALLVLEINVDFSIQICGSVALHLTLEKDLTFACLYNI